jgi:hypothetical protein
MEPQMTTKTRTYQTTSPAIFQWRSLKTRVTIFTLTFFLLGFWSLAFYSSIMLQKDMEHASGEQQFSTVSNEFINEWYYNIFFQDVKQNIKLMDMCVFV